MKRSIIALCSIGCLLLAADAGAATPTPSKRYAKRIERTQKALTRISSKMKGRLGEATGVLLDLGAKGVFLEMVGQQPARVVPATTPDAPGLLAATRSKQGKTQLVEMRWPQVAPSPLTFTPQAGRLTDGREPISPEAAREAVTIQLAAATAQSAFKPNGKLVSLKKLTKRAKKTIAGAKKELARAANYVEVSAEDYSALAYATPVRSSGRRHAMFLIKEGAEDGKGRLKLVYDRDPANDDFVPATASTAAMTGLQPGDIDKAIRRALKTP